MAKVKAKVLRYDDIAVATLFAKESVLLEAIQAGQLQQGLILWQCCRNTLVLPAGNKWQQTEGLRDALADLGWQLFARKTGGAPVPQTQGVINVSYLYALPEGQSYSIPEAYRSFCATLTAFFQHFAISVDCHATPGSYCDGDYNLNIAGKKVVGTAQRVVLKQGGGKVVLAQACILIDVNPEQLVAPVNLCYLQHQQQEQVRAEAHTCLFAHSEQRPNINDLYQILLQCFVNADKNSRTDLALQPQ